MKSFEPKIVAFCCHNCLQPNAVEIEKYKEANIKLIKLPCSGRIEVIHLLKAFESGVDGIVVSDCLKDKCQSLDGNLRAKARVEHTKRLLDEIGIGQERLQMHHLDSEVEIALAEAINKMLEKVNELGQNPLRKLRIERG